MSLSFVLRRILSHQSNLKYVAANNRPWLSSFVNQTSAVRFFSVTSLNKANEPAPEISETLDNSLADKPKEGEVTIGKGKVVEQIPVETSIRYLKSKAYSITYGSDPVWKSYRRNFKGGIPPKKTRKKCIRQGSIATGNPCPLCRDDYLVLSPENVELLKQFICPHSGEILSYSTTGVCQQKHKQLLSAIDIAKDQGAITFDVPFRSYDYSEYKKQ